MNQSKACQAGDQLVGLYKMNLQLIIVGTEGVRIFNSRDGNNNDGRTNNIYSLDLINNQTVMFNNFNIPTRSKYLIQRKLKGIRNISSFIKIKDNSTGVLTKLAKDLINRNI
jgi:hypothetical protein